MAADPMPPRHSPAALARRVLRAADRAVLATAGAEGWPYASLVLVALEPDGTPLLLLSRMAEHTRNIAADPRVSLLFDGTAGFADPLEGPRLTVLGRAAVSIAPGARARYLARHPGAAGYAGFGDFAMWRVSVARAHLVAGFGAIHGLSAAELLCDTAGCEALLGGEAAVVAELNARHADAIDACAARLTGGSGSGWRITGVDPEGCDLRRGGAVARLPFAARVADPAAARGELLRCAAAARAAGGRPPAAGSDPDPGPDPASGGPYAI